MKRRSSTGAWVVVLVLLISVACESDRAIPFYAESFEELCEGTPCGWERSVGTPDQATWVETIHIGEHALRLSGDVTVRGPGSDAVSSGASLRMLVTARCDPGSFLLADVVINDSLGSRTFTQSISTRDEWSGSSFFLDGGGTTRVVAIVFTKTGSGSCEVADIVIDDGSIVFGGC